MKKYFLSLIFLIVNVITAQQEEFYVLHVDGKITYGKNSILLTAGTTIKGNPTFNFSSSLDKAKLLGTKNGYWYLYPNEKKKNSGALLDFSFLKNIHPEKEFLATRGDESSLSYLFYEGSKLITNKRIKVFLKPKDTTSYYFIEFKYQGRILRKKLTFNENKKLIINHAVLELHKESVLLKDLSYANIGFFNASTTTYKILEGDTYSFVSIITVTKQLQYLKNNYKKQGDTPAIITKKLEIYLKNTYGEVVTLQNFKLN